MQTKMSHTKQFNIKLNPNRLRNRKQRSLFKIRWKNATRKSPYQNVVVDGYSEGLIPFIIRTGFQNNDYPIVNIITLEDFKKIIEDCYG